MRTKPDWHLKSRLRVDPELRREFQLLVDGLTHNQAIAALVKHSVIGTLEWTDWTILRARMEHDCRPKRGGNRIIRKKKHE